MFYAQLILAKKGVLGKIWLAAHWDKKLNRQLIFQTDVTQSAESIADPRKEMPLRVSGSLLLGVVRIFSHKVKYLSTDCDQALTKMKMSFRPGMELGDDREEEEGDDDEEEDEDREGGVEEGGGNRRESQAGSKRRDSLLKKGGGWGFAPTLDLLPPLGEEWLNAAAQSMARKQDITMEEGVVTGGTSLLERSLQQHEKESEEWEAFDPMALGDIVVDEQEEEPSRQQQEEEEVVEDGENRMEEDDYDDSTGFHDDTFDDGGDVDVEPDDPEMARREDGSAVGGRKKDSLDLGYLEEEAQKRKGSEDDGERDGDSMLVVDDNNHDDDEPLPAMQPSNDSFSPDGMMNGSTTSPLVARLSVGLSSIAKTPGSVGDTTTTTSLEGSSSTLFGPSSTAKKGRKRPLQADENIQISGKEFKLHLADYTDLLSTRVRPKDRITTTTTTTTAAEAATATTTTTTTTGSSGVLNMEERMSRPWMAGELSQDLDALFSQLMTPARTFSLPVQKVKGAADRSKKRGREDDEEEEGDGLDSPGGGKQRGSSSSGNVTGGVVEHKGADYDDDEEEGGEEDEEYYDDEVDMPSGWGDDDGGGGQALHHGDEEEEEEDLDFITQNTTEDGVMGGSDGQDAAGQGCKWHPNTVKMLKLLRKRVKDSTTTSTRKSGGSSSGGEAAREGGVVGFRRLSQGSQRNRAANQFFEVLQLKTWDFIQVKQEKPFGDIKVTPAARFHEAIPT